MNVKNLNEEKQSIASRLNGFLSRHRFILLAIPAALILIALAYGLFIFAQTNLVKKDFDKLDTILFNLEKASGLTEDELQVLNRNTKEELEAFIEKKAKGAASSKASMALAGLEFDDKNFEKAMNAYVKSALANPKAYTSSIAYYNAAICAEELGNLLQAIEFYEKVKEADNFALMPQVLFNMGRVSLDLKDTEAARVYFQILVEKYSSDSWANLAKSQLLALEIQERL